MAMVPRLTIDTEFAGVATALSASGFRRTAHIDVGQGEGAIHGRDSLHR